MMKEAIVEGASFPRRLRVAVSEMESKEYVVYSEPTADRTAPYKPCPAYQGASTPAQSEDISDSA